MIKSVLYMGGMAGDLVVCLLKPDQVEEFTNRVKLFDQYGRLKAYYKLTPEQKLEYYQKQSGILSSHDTEFHKQFPHETIRLVCKNNDTLRWMSRRFFDIINERRKDSLIRELKLRPDSYVEGYLQMMRNWQKSHPFPYQLDMSNVRDYSFVNDFLAFCKKINYPVNPDAVRQIYHDWNDQMVKYVI